jgi:VIT1/CCC1 family predicted Fe2+/Mn2+ transporter
MIGIAAARVSNSFLITAGIAGITAGAMSMAVGEYVSVRTQHDVEESDRLIEIEHLKTDPEGEFLELVEIYVKRGLSPELAREVAGQLHEKDALEAHLRDELGQFEHLKARPVQAAIASALSFTLGGVVPFIGAFTPGSVGVNIVGFTFVGLIGTGVLSARTSGASLLRPTVRVLIGGTLGMAITAGIGHLAHISGI